jgi:hypothetical protein
MQFSRSLTYYGGAMSIDVCACETKRDKHYCSSNMDGVNILT